MPAARQPWISAACASAGTAGYKRLRFIGVGVEVAQRSHLPFISSELARKNHCLSVQARFFDTDDGERPISQLHARRGVRRLEPQFQLSSKYGAQNERLEASDLEPI